MKTKLKLGIAIFSLLSTSYAEGLEAGHKYKIIKPVYLIADYNSRDNKSISKETAKAYLESARSAQKSITAFQIEVPVGTVMTIVGPAPKPWYLYFYADQYFINLNPDLSQGLDIKIQVDRGMEGNLDGLNPEIFTRL